MLAALILICSAEAAADLRNCTSSNGLMHAQAPTQWLRGLMVRALNCWPRWGFQSSQQAR
jgi:hypothetical protein